MIETIGGKPTGVALVHSIDGVTEAIETVDYPHHEIHSGKHFMYSDSISLDSAGTQDYVITTPDVDDLAHMLFETDGTAITQFQLFEDTTRAGTTLQTTFNNNRNSAITSGVTVHKGSGAGEDGTQILIYKSGAATQQARQQSNSRTEHEIVLKRNAKYLIRMTSGTNANLINLFLAWYEHTNKN